MQVSLCGGLEYPARKPGSLADAFRPRCKDHDIQLRRKRRHEPIIPLEPLKESQRRRSSTFQPVCEGSAADQRQESLRRPQRRGRGARSRTFQADLSQVKLSGTEISVRRIVFVKTSSGGIAK